MYTSIFKRVLTRKALLQAHGSVRAADGTDRSAAELRHSQAPRQAIADRYIDKAKVLHQSYRYSANAGVSPTLMTRSTVLNLLEQENPATPILMIAVEGKAEILFQVSSLGHLQLRQNGYSDCSARSSEPRS